MKKILLSAVLILALAATCYAIPVKHAVVGTGLERDHSRQDCNIVYYNYCSGWVYYWTGFQPDAKMGQCFDLNDCPGHPSPECETLVDVWAYFYPLATYGDIDIEVFCADDECCLVGDALVGWYNIPIPERGWYEFTPDPVVCLSECLTDKVAVVYTIHDNNLTSFFSDNNPRNITDGCQTVWDCFVHSWIWVDGIDYCDEYGVPSAFFLAYSGTGCFMFGTEGFTTELLCDIYLECLGVTATEDQSWSEIKALYK